MTSRDSERGRTSTMRIVDGLLLDGAEPDVVGIAAASGLPREEVEEIIATRRLLLAEGLLAPSAHVDAEAASLEVPDSEDPTTPPFARWIEERIGAAPVGAKRPGHLGRWVLDGPGTDHPLGAWFPAYERDGTLEADVLLLRADTPSGVVDRVFHASGLARGLEGGVWVAAYETGFEDDLGYLAFEPMAADLDGVVRFLAAAGGRETLSSAIAALAVGLPAPSQVDAASRASASAELTRNPSHVEAVWAFGAALAEALESAHRRDVLLVDGAPSTIGFDRHGGLKIRAPGVFDAAGAIARRSPEQLDDRAPEARVVHGVVGRAADAWIVALSVSRLLVLDGLPAESAATSMRAALEGRIAADLIDALAKGLSDQPDRRPGLARLAADFRKAAHPGFLTRWLGKH